MVHAPAAVISEAASHPTNGHTKLAYRIDEAAAATGLGRSSIYVAISSGQLKSFKAAGRRLILRTDLEEFLTACREAA